ncbi:MAG: alpha/beta fold hydrolase [Candidatus Binatia bacterium]|nr:alpha/beta fold hydrolase [Candidatus Binatia bacterium]
MKKRVLISLAILFVAALVFAARITQDGERIVPRGDGTVALDAGDFEAFPLPDYAAKYLPDGYESYFVEVEPGIKVHVLEVGSGLPLLLQHGNPTSGFLYRKVVEQLPTDRVRVILPTLVGLGFSSKVPASEHTLDNHIGWIHGVLEQLQLTEVVFAGQDWGGPIGMGALARSPHLLKGIVVLNTFFDAVAEEGDLSPGHAIARRPVVGELLIETLGLIFRNLPNTQGDPESLPADVLDLYRRPVVASGNGKAPLAMMRMVPDGPDHPTTRAMRVIEQYVRGLKLPAEIVWGAKDPILAGQLPAMRRHFPDAPITETEAGHFLQEEVPVEIAAALMRVGDQVRLEGLQEQERVEN